MEIKKAIKDHDKELLNRLKALRRTFNPKGKIKCDCDCGGPFCSSWTHVCNKPKEHYLQREEPEIEIKNQILDDIMKFIEIEED